MRKEQVLLLALLAALFGPASSQDHYDDISDECILKTSIVLKKLNTCDSQKIQDDFKRNQLWTDVVKETIDEMMKQLRAEIKSKSDQATEKLENKLDVAMKQAHDDKLEMKASMDRNLQSVEANKKQIEVVMKQAHDDKLEMKASMDRTLLSVEANKKQMDDLLKGHDKVKATMDRILQSDEAIKKQMEDLTMKVQSIKDCQRWLTTWSLSERNATLFFKAMGRNFYYKTQLVPWYESRDWCSSRGMQMATLKTADEMKQVANTLKSKISGGRAFWVSASDIGRSPGQYHWADGTPVLNSTWHSTQPDSHEANQETCAYINTGNEKLWDDPCSYTSRTLCEVPELLATCL